MDKKIAGLVGAVAGLATVGSAEAATPAHHQAEALQASSYADLLTPIPNAVELMRADDAAQAQSPQPASPEGVQQVAGFSVQFGYPSVFWNPSPTAENMAGFGQITSDVNTPRQFQFAARFMF